MKKFTRIGIPHLFIGTLLLAVAFFMLQGINTFELQQLQQASITPTPAFAVGNTEMRDFAPMRLNLGNFIFLPLVSQVESPETHDTTTPEQIIAMGIITYDDPSGSVQCHLTLAYETWTDLSQIIRLSKGTNVEILASAEAPTIWNGSREVYLVQSDGQTCYLRKELLQVQDIQQ